MINSIKQFYYRHRRPLQISIVLHILLFLIISIGITNNTVVKVEVPDNSFEQSIQATAIDSAEVDNLVKKITNEEKSKDTALKNAQKALERARRQKVAEEKRIKDLKAQKSKLERESKKLKEEQQTSLKKISQEKEKAKKQLDDLKKEQEKIAEKKKKLASERNQKIISEHTLKIINSINQQFIVNPEHIRLSLSCKIKIVLDDNGNVQNVILVTSSGNSQFDNSALAAVKKASPLPMPSEKNILSKFKVFMLTYRPEEFIG